MTSGSIDIQGNYHLVAAGQTSLSLSLPSLKVHTLAIAPKGAAGEPWIQLPEVDVADTTIALSERQVGVGQVTLQNPSLQVWREADGSLNLQRLLQRDRVGAIVEDYAGQAAHRWRQHRGRGSERKAGAAAENRAAATDGAELCE